MKKLLLVSHGTMAEGVCKAARMIIGDTSQLDFFCLSESMGIENFREGIREKLNQVTQSDQLIVLADLLGGSPFTTTLDVLSEMGLLENAHVIVGMNLILVLELMLAEGELTKEDICSYIENARRELQLFDIRPDDEEDSDF